jgi:hypothetical protein
VSCRQTYDIDLAAFLEAPRREEFESFRSHYPTCAACSAEVRAWTELHLALAATGAGEHPEPERLLRYEEDPGQMAPVEREALSTHLAGCVSCRDELSALRAFEPAALAQPAAAVTPDGGSGDGFLGRLRRLVWHPAFAYAVALLVLAPTLWQLVGPGQLGSPMLRAPLEATRRDEAFSGERAAARKEPAAEPTSPADVPGKERVAELQTRTAPPAVREKDAARSNREVADAAPAPGADPGALYSGFQRERLRPAPAQEQRPSMEAESIAKSKPSAPSAAKRQATAAAPEAGAMAASEDTMPDAADNRAAPAGPAEPKAESIEPLRRKLTEPDLSQLRSLGDVTEGKPGSDGALDEEAGRIATGVAPESVGPGFRRAARGLVLTVPTQGLEGELEVRLVSPDGRRQLVERFPAPRARAAVDLAVPPYWLGPGVYRVVVSGADGEHSWSVRPPH